MSIIVSFGTRGAEPIKRVPPNFDEFWGPNLRGKFILIVGLPESGSDICARRLEKTGSLVRISGTELDKAEQAERPGRLAEQVGKAKRNNKGVILEGYPRKIEELYDMYASQDLPRISLVMQLDAPLELIADRILFGRTCSKCGGEFNTRFKPTRDPMKSDCCGEDLLRRTNESIETVRTKILQAEKGLAPVIRKLKTKFYERFVIIRYHARRFSIPEEFRLKMGGTADYHIGSSSSSIAANDAGMLACLNKALLQSFPRQPGGS